MLTDQELQLLRERLSRKPLISEIAVFDAMWSEHCSYKSSKKHLATLYNNNKYVLAGAYVCDYFIYNWLSRISFTTQAHCECSTFIKLWCGQGF